MKRGTWVLLISSLVGSVGSGICWPFLGLHLYDLGASYLQIALSGSLAALMAILSRVWGAASDYYGLRKPFIIIGSLLSAVPIFFCGLVASPLSIIVLFMTSAFFGSISSSPYLAALTSVKERGKVIGRFSLLSTVGWTVGTFSMGFIHEYYGAFGVYAIAAMLIIISALVVLWYPKEPRLLQSESLRKYVKTAFTFKFKAPREFVWLLIAVFLCWFGFQWSGPLLRMRFYDLVDHSIIWLGIVWGVGSAITAILSPLAGKLADKIGGGRVVQATVLIYAFYTPLFALIYDPLLYSIVWIIPPLWPFLWVGTLLTPAQMTTESVRGEAMGAFNVALNLGTTTGLLGGIFADSFGREHAIIVAPIFFVAAWASLLPLVKSHKTLAKQD